MFRQAARLRLEDAGVLLERKRYGGAIYLAGYAVECLLKWAVTQRSERLYLPEHLEVHALDRLLLAAGLGPALRGEAEMRATFWMLADSWGPELRYMASEPVRAEAIRLYQAIVKVYAWIAERTI